MKSFLVANRNAAEARELKKIISQDYDVSVITSPEEIDDHLIESCLILLDHNFTDNSGVDFPMKIDVIYVLEK